MPTCTTGSLCWPLLKDTHDSSGVVSARLQVHSGKWRSNKHRGDTASAHCPLLLTFPQTNLCCLPLDGNLLSLTPFLSIWLSLSLHLPFHFTRASKWNESVLMFFFAGVPDYEQAKCCWQQTGWQISSSAWSLGVPSLREKIRDTNPPMAELF